VKQDGLNGGPVEIIWVKWLVRRIPQVMGLWAL
jgi:hypothetical protein